MSDLGHDMTDVQLNKLERRIASVYKRADEEVRQKVKQYFSNFAVKDKKMQQAATVGEITEQDLINWRYNQMAVGKRWKDMAQDMAQTYLDANKQAAAMMNETSREVFALNHNFAAYEIENRLRANLNFTLYDSAAVARLIKEEPTLLPPKRVMPAKDMRWNMKQLSREVTQGILQGESVGKLANRVQNVTGANRVSAVRAARTAITGAECAGRMDSYRRAEQMGIKLRKEWVATLDSRTRHAHQLLDGQKVEQDKPFVAEGKEIMFPGDPTAAASLVYNCRCTMIAALDDVDELDPVYRRVRDPGTGRNEVIEERTYKEWVREHQVEINSGYGSRDNFVNKEVLNGKAYKEKFSGLTGNRKVDDAAFKYTKQAVLENNATDNETVFLLNMARGGKLVSTTRNANLGGAVVIPGGHDANSLLLTHNHPNNTIHSFEDISAMNATEEIGAIITAGHDGSIYYLAAGERIAQDTRMRYNELDHIWSGYVMRNRQNTVAALQEFANDYGWTFEVR